VLGVVDGWMTQDVIQPCFLVEQTSQKSMNPTKQMSKQQTKQQTKQHFAPIVLAS
jgi:hypothetical protein